jgi:hypothetical protein
MRTLPWWQTHSTTLAAVVHLAQLALRIVLVAAVDHQVVHHHAEPRPDLECIFHEPVGMHKTPFTSMKFRGVYAVNSANYKLFS